MLKQCRASAAVYAVANSRLSVFHVSLKVLAQVVSSQTVALATYDKHELQPEHSYVFAQAESSCPLGSRATLSCEGPERASFDCLVGL